MPLLQTFANDSIRGWRNGGAPAGAYEWISTVNGTGSSGTVTFSSIPQTYKHLQIRATACSTRSDASSAGFRIRFNGDTTTAGWTHYLQGYPNAGTAPQSQNFSTTGYTYIGDLTTIFNSDQAYTGSTVIDILNYTSTVANKTTRSLNGFIRPTITESRIQLVSGLWPSTAAVTSISLITSVNFFTNNSKFSLYGIKGA